MRKILFNRKDFIGNRFRKTRAGKNIISKDVEDVLNKFPERKSLFATTKKYVKDDGVVTVPEMREALAELKYGSNDHLNRKEIDTLAKELDINRVDRRAYHIAKKRWQQEEKKVADKKEAPQKRGQHTAFRPDLRKASATSDRSWSKRQSVLDRHHNNSQESARAQYRHKPFRPGETVTNNQQNDRRGAMPGQGDPGIDRSLHRANFGRPINRSDRGASHRSVTSGMRTPMSQPAPPQAPRLLV